MFRRREERTAYSPYQAFMVDEMILRDHLAVDRTSLANERTLLSYLRTALACVAGGASTLHFLDGAATEAFGVALIVAGVVTAAFGVQRYRWYRRRIEVVTARSALPSPPRLSDAN